MTDVCIVYAKENKKVAAMLFELLSTQWNVWMDNKIVGSFSNAIEKELPSSKCVVAVNSKVACDKKTYRAELHLADKNQVPIIPVRLDNSDPPYPFNDDSHVDMQDWAGELDNSGFIELKTKIAEKVPPKGKPQRPNAIANNRLPLPSVFMSVSSYETRLEPLEAIAVLQAFETPTILVSAYDLANNPRKQSLIKKLRQYQRNGGYVLIDSGIYEARRFRDKSWSEKSLIKVLDNAPHHMAFSFDNLKPYPDSNRYVENITKRVNKHKKKFSKPIIPIIHVLESEQGIKEIPNIICNISRELAPAIIAIPERELGAGIIARARTIRNIRMELNKLPNYQPIHILGTGHPWSVAILAAAGADTFDGLEWCRYTIDHETEVINHFHHFDLLAEIKGSEISYLGEVACHNLRYYKTLGMVMHDMVTRGSVESFVRGILSKRAFNRLNDEFPELFK